MKKLTALMMMGVMAVSVSTIDHEKMSEGELII